jgi:sulfate transport system permease protein
MSTTIAPPGDAARDSTGPRAKRHRAAGATGESATARWILIGTALAYLFLFLGLPLFVVFAEAFKKGGRRRTSPHSGNPSCCTRCADAARGRHRRAAQRDVRSRRAWAITKGKVRGHALLVALADLPLASLP